MFASCLPIALLLLSLHVSLSSYAAAEWSAHTHAGKTYYYNTVTGKSQWEAPVGFSGKAQAATVAPANFNRASYATEQTQRTFSTQHLYPNPNNLKVEEVNATGELNTTTSTTTTISGANSTAINIAVASTSSSSAATKAITDLSRYTNFPHRDLVSLLVQSEAKVSALSMTVDELRQTKDVLQKRLVNESALVQSLTSNLTMISEKKRQMLSKIEQCETDIINVNILLDKETKERQRLEEELSGLRGSLSEQELALEALEANSSRSSEELAAARQYSEQQQGELGTALAEIERLEADLRAVSAPSLKELRRHSSIFARVLRPFAKYFSLLSSASGVDSSEEEGEGGGGSSSSSSLDLRRARELNKTVTLLRQNLTAAALALETKEDLIVELSEQIEEFEEEADKRRKSYAALKHGIATLQNENRELDECVQARDAELLDVAVQLDREAEERRQDVSRLQISLETFNRSSHARQVMSSVLIARLEGEVERAGLELSRLETYVLALRGELESKVAEFSRQRALNSDMAEERSRSEAQLHRLEVLLGDVRADLQDSRDMCQEKDSRIVELRLELESSLAEAGVKDSFISHLKQKVLDHNSFSQQQDSYIDSLREELAALQAQVDELRRDAGTGDSLYRSIFGVL